MWSTNIKTLLGKENQVIYSWNTKSCLSYKHGHITITKLQYSRQDIIVELEPWQSLTEGVVSFIQRKKFRRVIFNEVKMSSIYSLSDIPLKACHHTKITNYDFICIMGKHLIKYEAGFVMFFWLKTYRCLYLETLYKWLWYSM